MILKKINNNKRCLGPLFLNFLSYFKIYLNEWKNLFFDINSRSKNLMMFVLFIKKTGVEKDQKNFDKLYEFLHIWPLEQWVFSLLTLILLYWLIGTWYNKRLVLQGGWLTWQSRIVMIILDILINLSLGVYYMGARDTFMGQIMFRCPIAVSPVIFVLEFVVFVWYYKTYILIKKNKVL